MHLHKINCYDCGKLIEFAPQADKGALCVSCTAAKFFKWFGILALAVILILTFY